jgi:hypothetical protein
LAAENVSQNEPKRSQFASGCAGKAYCPSSPNTQMKKNQVNVTPFGDISRNLNYPRVRLGQRVEQKTAPDGKSDSRTVCARGIAMVVAREMLKWR